MIQFYLDLGLCVRTHIMWNELLVREKVIEHVFEDVRVSVEERSAFFCFREVLLAGEKGV